MADTMAPLEGGFADPVFDAQAAFSAIMGAFARPGTIVDLAGLAQPPAPVPPAAGAFLAALADYDTPVWLDDAAKATGIADWLIFHTGAAIVADPAAASFALICEPSALPSLSRFAVGTADFPDRSATLILCLPDLRGGPTLLLTGPGIETEAFASPRGLPASFLSDWADNRGLYPCGIDVLLVAGAEALGLPRTTQIAER
ncbi:phosphonate C-P lyase system protein PhnH [Aurantimonas aggregata]|uniref:Phosphonate C-P lyase system protein PhnH n=1 Tax=Aurantimonas aggregata TaxID=2047720 RepID=A0A6L9MKX9_9HYPH|nr:phosphonate C-P lyase system protein PhnH [Aurantimonas aggregata]NDV88544.1 phosphonate C-P lyase system protein PhnH [Aurantimonas aggregata]